MVDLVVLSMQCFSAMTQATTSKVLASVEVGEAVSCTHVQQTTEKVCRVAYLICISATRTTCLGCWKVFTSQVNLRKEAEIASQVAVNFQDSSSSLTSSIFTSVTTCFIVSLSSYPLASVLSLAQYASAAPTPPTWIKPRNSQVRSLPCIPHWMDVLLRHEPRCAFLGARFLANTGAEPQNSV